MRSLFASALLVLLVQVAAHAQAYGTDVESVTRANLASFLGRAGYTPETFNDGSCIIKVTHQGTLYTIRTYVGQNRQLWLQSILGATSPRAAQSVFALNSQLSPSFFNQREDGQLQFFRPLSTVNLDAYGFRQGLTTFCNQINQTSTSWRNAVLGTAQRRVARGQALPLAGTWISAKSVLWQVQTDGAGHFTAQLSAGPGRAACSGSASGSWDGTSMQGTYELRSSGQVPVRGRFSMTLDGNILSGTQNCENTLGQHWDDKIALTRR